MSKSDKHEAREDVASTQQAADKQALDDRSQVTYDSTGYPQIPFPDRMTHKAMHRSLREILTYYYRKHQHLPRPAVPIGLMY